MRILLITSVNVFLESGGGFVNRAIYDSLILHYAGEVDVIQYDYHGPSDEGMGFFHVPAASIASKSISLCCGKIHHLYGWLKDFLNNNKNVYSVCFLNSGLFGDVVPLLKTYGIQVVTLHHNYEPTFQKENKRPTTLWGISSIFVKRNERIAFLNSDANLFLTNYDKETFIEQYGYPDASIIFLLGLYETKKQSESHDKSHERLAKKNKSSVAICGSLDSVQTESGIMDFERHYFNIAKRIIGESLSVIITGRNPRKSIVKFASSNDSVNLIPNPPIIDEVIKECGIFLCPTNIGSGIKLRLLDGIRAGMPIVAHEVSARGYEIFQNREWFFRYSDESSFETALKGIADFWNNNPDGSMSIIDDYYSAFSFDSGDQRLHSVLKQIVGY